MLPVTSHEQLGVACLSITVLAHAASTSSWLICESPPGYLVSQQYR
jgi:hypothetical protein